ncbi:sperm flagellar protein 1-like [Talpa occidentalis]|uniref:sperm flagellar protein 1-like n=1 Tax=Talpa occidentalis TaxID=50954 RepID=UPI00188F6AC5|nr:sperm flagellar protein 1-like [Talpa occidentalis]
MPGAATPIPPAPPLPRGALRGLHAWLDALPLGRRSAAAWPGTSATAVSAGRGGGLQPRAGAPTRWAGPVPGSPARALGPPGASARAAPRAPPARSDAGGDREAPPPRLADLHNYVPTCKLSSRSILSRKVFHKLRFCVSEADIRKVVANTPGAIEPILCVLREKVEASTRDRPGTAGPRRSTGDADRPRGGSPPPAHTGRQDPPRPLAQRPSGMSHLQTLATAQGGLSPVPPPRVPADGCWPSRRPEPVLPPQLEEKEQALALLQEAVRLLQMKVHRLELLLELRGRRIAELTRWGPGPSRHLDPDHGPRAPQTCGHTDMGADCPAGSERGACCGGPGPHACPWGTAALT